MPVKFRGGVEDKKIYGSTQEAADEGAKLMGLMNNGKKINKGLTDLLSQNPTLQAMYEQDPDLVTKFMYNPVILKYMMGHPDVVQKFLDDPTLAQNSVADPVSALMDYLQQKKPNTAQKLMNEMRRRRNGFKL
jgi:hypothetical protein